MFLSDKFAYLISYAESKARPPSAPNVVIWAFCPVNLIISVFLPGQNHPRDQLSHFLCSTRVICA